MTDAKPDTRQLLPARIGIQVREGVWNVLAETELHVEAGTTPETITDTTRRDGDAPEAKQRHSVDSADILEALAVAFRKHAREVFAGIEARADTTPEQVQKWRDYIDSLASWATEELANPLR